jgi:hypothetical protein
MTPKARAFASALRSAALARFSDSLAAALCCWYSVGWRGRFGFDELEDFAVCETLQVPPCAQDAQHGMQRQHNNE